MADHIQVQDIVPRIQFTADGINTAFQTPFIVFNEQALDVYLNDQKVTTDFTIELDNEMRATVTFDSAPANGTLVTLSRHLAIERTSDFQEGGSLRANTLNYELDYQTACLQELADNINRSMVLPPYAVGSDTQLTLPLPNPGKSIVWSEDGTSLENSSVSINAINAELDEKVANAAASVTSAQNAAQSAQNAATLAENMALVAQSQAGIAEDEAQAAQQMALEAASVLEQKANVDMDNISDTGKSYISSLAMPSGTYIDLVYSNSQSYTSPANGYYYIRGTTTGNAGGISLHLGADSNSTNYLSTRDRAPSSGQTVFAYIGVGKDTIITPEALSAIVSIFRFYYAQGEI